MANTQLSALAGFIKDISNNDATVISGINVSNFTPALIDTNLPTLISWNLTITSATAGSIVLSVSENIVTSFDVTKVSITIGSTSYTLTNSTASVTGRIITITLSSADATALDNLLTKTTGGTTTTAANNITLTLEASWTTDLSPLPNDAAEITVGVNPLTFTAPADTTAPVLSSWDLNLLSSSTIVLNYSEVVDVSTLSATDLTINTYTLTGGTVNTVDSNTVGISLTSSDRDEIIKVTSNTKPGTTLSSSGADYIFDLSSNGAAQLSSEAVDNFTGAILDTDKPTLNKWSLNIASSNTATAIFTADKQLSAADATKFTITIEGEAIAIDSTNTVVVNGSQINVSFSPAQSAALHAELDIVAGSVNTLSSDITLAATADWATDTSLIANTAAALSSVNPNTFGSPADNVPPSLINWDLDLELDRVTLIFDEVVDPSSLVFASLTIKGIVLTGGTLVSSANSNTIVFNLSTVDADALLVATNNVR